MKTPPCALTLWGSAAIVSAMPVSTSKGAENDQPKVMALTKRSLPVGEVVKQRRASQPDPQAADIAYTTSTSVFAAPLAVISPTVVSGTENLAIVDTPPTTAVHKMVYSNSVANSTSTLQHLDSREHLDGGLAKSNWFDKRSGGCCDAPGLSADNHWAKRGAVSCCSGLSPSGG